MSGVGLVHSYSRTCLAVQGVRQSVGRAVPLRFRHHLVDELKGLEQRGLAAPALANARDVHTSPGPHAELWRRFWDYANDRELAERAGLRAVHGEAPFIELRPGGRYSVELRASGGLSIRPE